jgi:hypothetical protein
MKSFSKIITVLLTATCSISALADEYIHINTVNDGAGTGWRFESPTLTIFGDGGAYTITGNGETASRITVTPGITASITLDNVNINVGGSGCAFNMNGATVNLTLEGDNILKSGEAEAGLKAGSGSTLKITAAGTGSLTATGGLYAAGIGGGHSGSGGNIIISGGTVTARGGSGAGIGGGSPNGHGGNVTISGGTVTAIGGSEGAGIGGGEYGNGGHVIISGGTVTATTGDSHSADIGSGFIEEDGMIGGGSIIITGGSVFVNDRNTKENRGPQPTSDGTTPVYCNTLQVGSPAVNEGVPVTAGSISGRDCNETPSAASGVYGIRDVKTDAFGKVYFYLPSTTTGSEWVKLTANGMEYGKNYTRNKNNSNSQTLLLPPCRITLDQTGTYAFSSASYGYDAQSGRLFTVTSAGSDPTGLLTVALSGADPSAFTLSESSISSIDVTGGTDDFTVTPKTGLAIGIYTETVTVSGNNDITASFDVSFTVDRAALTEDLLEYTLAGVDYNGSSQGIKAPALKPEYSGMGTVTIYYTSTDGGISYPKSATAPVNAGDYNVTADIAEGDIFAAVTDLLLGVYRIIPATPTVAELDFTLSDAIYDDRLHPVTVTPAAGIEGLGAITVRYNGSTIVPVYPGAYTVTIDIAAGTNYAAVTGLPAGTFNIDNSPTPVIRRRVILRPAPGLTTDPPADTYYINSGTNFTFRLTPDVPLPDGTSPQVHTTRAGAPDGSTGIRMTANADGSYTVAILAIRQSIEITFSTSTDNVPVAADALTLGAAPGALVIANSRPDATAVYVYNLAGTLVRRMTVAPGTTRLSVPPGTYIVTDGGAFRRKAVVAR